ncbi:MAG: hypothetical protein HYV63_33925 [Candidatus Schekmanbacteria bacterium]|nr:hypothetical protein [Candidatus Schekmanbacteria bacterium]
MEVAFPFVNAGGAVVLRLLPAPLAAGLGWGLRSIAEGLLGVFPQNPGVSQELV